MHLKPNASSDPRKRVNMQEHQTNERPRCPRSEAADAECHTLKMHKNRLNILPLRHQTILIAHNIPGQLVTFPLAVPESL